METSNEVSSEVRLLLLRFECLTLTLRVIALARQLCHSACIGTGSTAVFCSIREHTVTSGMRASS